jgi:hypothetical protein
MDWVCAASGAAVMSRINAKARMVEIILGHQSLKSAEYLPTSQL